MFDDDEDSNAGALEMDTLPATRTMAEEVAQILFAHPGVEGVLLFGSVAREGRGHDLDLILLADDERYQRFLTSCREQMKSVAKLMSPLQLTGQAYHARLLRRGAAIMAFDDQRFKHDQDFGSSFLLRLDSAGRASGNGSLDLFVFPTDWRERLTELQEDLPHGDPNFMTNIARDAIKIS